MESSAMLAAAVDGGAVSSSLLGLGLANSSSHIPHSRLRICRLTPPTAVGWRRRRWRQLCVPIVRCIHGPPSSAAASHNDPHVSCSAVAQEASSVLSSSSGCPGGDESIPQLRLRQLADEFRALPEPIDRVKRLLEYAAHLPPLPDADRTPGNRVMGCTAQVWLAAAMDGAGRMRFAADSDSEITRGFCACLVSALDGAAPEEVMEMRTEDLAELNVVGGAAGTKVPSRVNTWHNVLVSMQKRTKALVAQGDGQRPVEPFPSLVIGLDGFQPKGSYAEAQAKYLSPDMLKVTELVDVLKEKKIGVVAHFYMDPEVQGVLTAAQKLWPHIHISDSLVMADKAVKMAEAGCEYITVLGVDFMSENVRSILDQAGFEKVDVYRMSSDQIGCSLADAAASPAYLTFLETASRLHPSLHVIYINTSLETKAHSHELVPTITCTSSNVVQTILQAFAQIPDLNVWYGPDSYMGANIAELFNQMANMSDEEIKHMHPEHDRNSIRSLLPRLHYFQMNSLRSLLKVCHQLPDREDSLWAYKAKRFSSKTPLGRSVAEVGCEPILHMRHFQAIRELPDMLVHQILNRPNNGLAVP